jgi:hypothetical protein
LSKLKNFIAQEIELSASATGVSAIREGRRAILADDHNGYSLGKYLAGQLPQHYRSLEGIAADFSSGDSSLEAVLAMISCMPTVSSFQNSHCGEIAAAHYVEDHLGYKRLYSKLTMITSQNTNAHKMDGLFVKTDCDPFEYLFVEVKCSILPTSNTKTKTHRSGILKQMLSSLHSYHNDDPRFEYSRIRDNLEKSFPQPDASAIRSDLIPPGPENLRFLGISVTNAATINSEDDDFILSSTCNLDFDYHAIVVTDLAALSQDAYGKWLAAKAALG